MLKKIFLAAGIVTSMLVHASDNTLTNVESIRVGVALVYAIHGSPFLLMDYVNIIPVRESGAVRVEKKDKMEMQTTIKKVNTYGVELAFDLRDRDGIALEKPYTAQFLWDKSTDCHITTKSNIPLILTVSASKILKLVKMN